MIDALLVCVALWGRGQGRRRGAGGAYRRPCPVLPSAHCGGRSVNLNAAVSASPGRRLLPVLSVCPRRSTYRWRSSWAHLCIQRFSEAVWDRGRCQRRNARRDVQAQTWKQTAAPECNSRYAERSRDVWVFLTVGDGVWLWNSQFSFSIKSSHGKDAHRR